MKARNFDGNGHHAEIIHDKSPRKRSRSQERTKDGTRSTKFNSTFAQHRQTNNLRRQQKQQFPMNISISSIPKLLIFALLTYVFAFLSVASANDEVNWLSQDSVVLILGAATSLLGSEVALALYRLFHCHVVLVDDLNSGKNSGLMNQLSTMEFHRQSLFRVWQELDDQLILYRMNPRSIVPDIDPGTTVDRLSHVMDKHRPTHVLIFPETPESYRGETDDAPPRAGILEGTFEQVLSFHEKYPGSPLPHVVWMSSEEVYPSTGTWSESDVPPMPRNKEGADAMVNEVIARAYDKKGVPSVALRISKHVYGPFQEPVAPLFALMENVLRIEEAKTDLVNLGDYLYVDDAVDAVLAALQLPNVPHSFAVNVGSGNSQMSMEQMITRIRGVISGGIVDAVQGEGRRLRLSLAEQILNFHPRVSLAEGLKRSLAWHFDRMFPFGPDGSSFPDIRSIAGELGVASCTDAGDTECLRGTPILPCASECAHSQQCRETAWDNIIPKLETWTASCPSILYTIRQTVPVKVSVASPHNKTIWPDVHCNIAFIPSSILGDFKIVNGWTVVPLQIDLDDVDSWLVPLWSPGRLFPRSKWAIYTAPNVAWENLDRLMEAVHIHPEGGSGSVALLLGTREAKDRRRNSSQRHAYRAIHIKATEFLESGHFQDGFVSNVDAESWLVHRLRHPDSEQLRCDVSKEISGWKGVVDFHAAAAFVFGLHDLWSQMLLHEKGAKSWWHGSQVVSVPDVAKYHRRLEEQTGNPASSGERKAQAPVEPSKEKSETSSEFDEDGEDEEELEDVHHFDHNGFGVTRKVAGGTAGEGKENLKKDDDETQQLKDDDAASETGVEFSGELDPSDYDTWLGAISSSNTNMFIRLVDPKLVGATFLDEHDSLSSK